MPNDGTRAYQDNVDRLARIDELCDRYEALWQAGQRLSVAEFLLSLGDSPARSDAELQHELIRIVQAYSQELDVQLTPHETSNVLAFFQNLQTDQRVDIPKRERIAIGRSRHAEIPIRDRACSKQQCELKQLRGEWFVVPISEVTPTRINGQAITVAARLRDGDTLTVGETNLAFRLFAPKAVAPVLEPMAATASPVARTILDGDLDGSMGPAEWSTKPVAIQGDLLVGRDPKCKLVLDHPLVSRRHARISQRKGETYLTDLVSANGTFLNGRRIIGKTLLAPDDCIDIGPYTLRFTGTQLAPSSRSGNIDLQCWRVTRTVPDRQKSGSLTLLDDVSIRVRPGQFVCLLGPSGSGKSTLLSALSGRSKPDRGAVLMNGHELYSNFHALRREMAVVHQRDLAFDLLTVRESFTYTARLRLPADSTEKDLRREVDSLLKSVGLTQRQDIPIGRLSGGQLKRVSLGNELMGRPSLIFLDEVTSGLDEQTDREMMALFRQMADAGKTIVCITHSLAHVERYCHGVVILAPGGVLAFSGTPAEAKSHFGIERLGDVYEALDRNSPSDWRKKFESHPNFLVFADSSLESVSVPAAPQNLPASFAEGFRQGLVLLARRLRLLLCNRPALVTLAMQTAVVAGALGLVFGNLSNVTDLAAQARDSVTLYFLLTVSSFWFGCNGAVKVLVSERPLYRLERSVNLSAFGYGGSTFAVHSGIAVLQVAVMTLSVWALCHPPGMGFAVLGILALTGIAGTGLGLAISAASGTEEQAVAGVPLTLIPQIIFGGTIAVLSGPALWCAKLGITSYWAQRGNSAQLPDDLAAAAGLSKTGSMLTILVLVLHTAVFLLVSSIMTLYRDARAYRR
jgi:ABC-type multidrug transport system ATPase subunit/pSer/pThr/pTyr-binding forkhead associated (FHA) protein